MFRKFDVKKEIEIFAFYILTDFYLRKPDTSLHTKNIRYTASRIQINTNKKYKENELKATSMEKTGQAQVLVF